MSHENMEQPQGQPGAAQTAKEKSSEKLVGAKEALKQKLLRAVMKQAMEEIGSPDSIAEKALSAIDKSKPPLPTAANRLQELLIAEIASQAFASIADSEATAGEIAQSLSIERDEIQKVIHALRAHLDNSIGDAAIATLADAQLTATELSDRVSIGRPEIQKVVQALRERVAASIRQEVLRRFEDADEVTHRISETISPQDQKLTAVRDRLLEQFLHRIQEETLSRLSNVDDHVKTLRARIEEEPAQVVEIANRLQNIFADEARERTLKKLENVDGLVNEVLASLGDNIQAVSVATERARDSIIEEISQRAKGLLADVDASAKSARARIGTDPTEIVAASHRLKEILLQEIARRSADSVRSDGEAIGKAFSLVDLDAKSLVEIREGLKKRILTQVLSSAISEIHEEVAVAASEVGLNLNIEDIVFDFGGSEYDAAAADVSALDGIITGETSQDEGLDDVLDSLSEKKSPNETVELSEEDQAAEPWQTLAEIEVEPQTEVSDDDVDAGADESDSANHTAEEMPEWVVEADVEIASTDVSYDDPEWMPEVDGLPLESPDASADVSSPEYKEYAPPRIADRFGTEEVETPDAEVPSEATTLTDAVESANVTVEAANVTVEAPAQGADERKQTVEPVSHDGIEKNSEWAPRQATAEKVDEVYYVYGVLSTAGPALEGPVPLGLNGVRVESIDFDGLSAIVSRVPATTFSGEVLKTNLKDAAWIQENVRKHASIIEQLRSRQTLLPMAFCTVFPTQDAVVRLLKGGYEDYFDALDHVQGKQEWGLRIYRNMSTLQAKVSESDRRLEGAFSSISKGVVGYLRGETRKMDDDSQNAIQLMTDHCTQRSHESVLTLAADGRRNPDGGGHPRDNEDVVLNMAYLVAEECDVDVRSEVERLQTEYADLGFRYELTGPWPPYHFVTPEKERDTVRSRQ